MTFLQQLGIVPGLLVTLGGLLVLRSAEDERAPQRLLRYLLVVGSVLLVVFLAALLMTPPQDNRPFWQVSHLLTPVFIGVLALIVLHGRQLSAMPGWAILLALLVAAGLAWMLTNEAAIQWGLSYYFLPGVLVLVLGWAAGRRFPKAAVFIGFLLLAALFGLNWLFSRPAGELSPLPPWSSLILQAIIAALPGLIVVVTAVLLANSFWPRRGRRRPLLMLMPVGLLAYLAYSIFWTSVWDQTSDGIGGLFLTQPSALAAVGAGMVMALTIHRRGRGVGLLFAVLVPLLLYQSFEQGWQVSYHALTKARAERIAQALDQYRQGEGIYPPALDALTPRYLLRVPQPVELQGESWCYQGGGDFYRLGAFTREFFSMPVELQVYAAEGEPDGSWPCEAQLAAMKERYYSPMEDPQAMRPPPPTPLPPSDAATGAETLSPLLDGGNQIWGSWSPDGAYFLLGQQDTAGGATLSFLDGKSGSLCEVVGSYTFPPHTVSLQPYHAWLPDGQLFLLDGSGQIALLAPCEPGARIVMPESGQSLTEIVARSEAGERLLLKTSGEFWIFDGRVLAWRPIPAVTPTPYEAHWDNAAWQPDGELLAIARLNGRDAREGSTLAIVDGDTGEVLRSLSLSEASDQSAASVDWLSPQELLIMGGGVLRILDLESEPPGSTDVLRELFQLDLDFPGQVWGHGWEVDWDDGSYMLTLRANHPRNQAAYVYRSATGTTEAYDEDHNLLLLHTGGLEMWMKPEMEPGYDDAFMLVDLESGQIYPPLAIAGHTPRDYPHLDMAYLPEPALLAVASSQGVSLHTLPDGETAAFWTLAGEGFAPFLRPAPDGSALIAIRDQGGLYWIPLPPGDAE